MKASLVSYDYGFGGTPIITFALSKDANVTPSVSKSLETAIGQILSGRQVVLSGKEITMHGGALAPHEVSMYTSVCQNNAELSATVERLQAENARLTVKLEKFQKVVDTHIENDRAMFMLSTQSETVRKRREELQGRR